MTDEIPNGFMFTAEDAWAIVEDQGNVLAVGFTPHGMRAVGDIKAVELPRIGQFVTAGETVCAIEGFSGTTVLHSPATGQIIESNETVARHPETASGDPYSHWLYKVTMSDKSQMANLMGREAYQKMVDVV